MHFFGMRKNMMLTSVNLCAKLVCFLYSISGGSEWDFCVNFFSKKEEK